MKRRGSRGGSLLEVLASMALFAIVASSITALSVQTIRRTSENRHGTGAALLAQQEMERVRALDYPNITNTSSSAMMSNQSYTISTGVQTDVPAANMKTITVTVSWYGPEGSKSYVLKTIYTDITAS